MANITLKNVPDELYERLKAVAARRRRSLNSEIIVRLERSLGAGPVDSDALLARTRAVRERLRVPYLTDAQLRAARDEGRS
ncbi:MAG: FitA-like ribbon-helix-helix domain-containing protein [Candidatus Longimicrobiales bacterium M2_2A_002]